MLIFPSPCIIIFSVFETEIKKGIGDTHEEVGAAV